VAGKVNEDWPANSANTFRCWSAVRNEEKMAGTFISPIDHPSEEYECLDCSIVTKLNEHGRCPRCGSNAVMQFMVLEKVGRWINVRDVRFWVPNDLPYEDGAPSAVLIPEKPQHSRTNIRRNAPVLALAVEKRCA
jgi:DNA-directed RNA polymerase subunit RPC12/RpoP